MENEMRLNRLFGVAAILLLLAATGTAQDTIPNPEFANWSKFKKGTSVTHKATTEVMGMASEVLVTNTLLETGGDKVVIESSTVVKANGMEFKTPPMKRDVTKTITLPKGVKKEEAAAGKPPGTIEEGTETLKIAGVEVKTKWYKYSAEVDKVKTEGRTWMSDDVPGMLVKTELSTSGTFATKTKMELVEFKKP
jgi:hypothetical protein